MTEHYVRTFRWELTAFHQKQFGKAHPVYTFLKSLCNFNVAPLRANTQVGIIAEAMGMDPRTVERHLARLQKFNYITKRQTQRGLAFEIVLNNDKYVGPASTDKPVIPGNDATTKLSDLNDKTVGPKTTKLSDLNENDEKLSAEKQKGLQPSPDNSVTPLRFKGLDSFQIKPDVGLLICFFQRTHFKKNNAYLPDEDFDEFIPQVLKIIPSHRVARRAWWMFLHCIGYEHDQWLRDVPKTLKIFHGQIKNGKFVEQASRFLEKCRAEQKQSRKPLKPKRAIDPFADALWEKTKEKIKLQVGGDSFEAWFEPTYPRDINGVSITIAVPNQFYRKCLLENYRELIESTIQTVDDNYYLVDFVIDSEIETTVGV